MAWKEDYIIGGELTKHAIDELLALEKLDELEDLLHNASEPQLQNGIALDVSHEYDWLNKSTCNFTVNLASWAS